LACRRFSLQCSRRTFSRFAYGWNYVVSMSGVVFMPRLVRNHCVFAVCGAEFFEAALDSWKTPESFCAQWHDRRCGRSKLAGIALAAQPKIFCICLLSICFLHVCHTGAALVSAMGFGDSLLCMADHRPPCGSPTALYCSHIPSRMLPWNVVFVRHF
jgi:hypothetical protein